MAARGGCPALRNRPPQPSRRCRDPGKRLPPRRRSAASYLSLERTGAPTHPAAGPAYGLTDLITPASAPLDRPTSKDKTHQPHLPSPTLHLPPPRVPPPH